MTKRRIDGIAAGGRIWAEAFAAAIRPPGAVDAEVMRLRADLERVTRQRDAVVCRQLELLGELVEAYSMIELLTTPAADGEH
jgi:hypothetical protein